MDAWSMPAADMSTDFRVRPTADAREAFDAYQDRRALEGALDTAVFHNSTRCAAQPQLDVADLGAHTSWISPLHCGALTPALLGWERRESVASAGRRADNAAGPVVDVLLDDARLGWSDAAALTRMPRSGGGGAMRLAAGVSMTSTRGGGSGSGKPHAHVAHNVGMHASPAGIGFAPAAAPMHAHVGDMGAAFAAMYAHSRAAPASPAAVNLRPGAMIR